MENRYKNGKKIVRVAVNLSRMDLMDDEIMDLIIDDVKDERYSKQMVNYEVTESAYANVSGKGTNFLIQLHDNGVKLLIDDFGSGMSSFSTLRDYDFDVIKLDMGFVQKLGENKKYNNIVMSILDKLTATRTIFFPFLYLFSINLRTLLCTYVSSFVMCPLSSSAGINLPGSITPLGETQRTRASADAICFVFASYIG